MPDLLALNGDEDRQSTFRRESGNHVATKWAGGPWDTGACHGGAVAGLLVMIARQVPSQARMELARLTMNLFGPVPIGKAIESRVKIEKDGARVQFIEVALLVDDRRVATGNLLRVRVETRRPAVSNLAKVDPSRSKRGAPGGFAKSFDVVAELGGITQQGPGRVWFRLATPLIENEPADLSANAVAIADFSSAIGMSRDFSHFNYPSVDLTVGLARAPVDDWILVDACNHDSDLGRATSHGVLSDAQGPFARVVQTIFVERRSTALSEVGN